VIVVRPSAKRAKKKAARAEKRKTDLGPSYKDLLAKAGVGVGGDRRSHLAERSNREFEQGTVADPEGGEAAAVAAAIGLPHALYKTPTPLTGVQGRHGRRESSQSNISDRTDFSAEPSSPEDMRSPGVVMKSPDMEGDLASPELSEEEGSDDEEGEFEAVSGDSLLPEGEGVPIVQVDGEDVSPKGGQKNPMEETDVPVEANKMTTAKVD
jgi:hypothetical protein